jgi:intracellular sulfur oxidation DsrE/DsrF family protein
MAKNISGWSVFTACVLLWAAPIYAQNGMSSRSEPSLHIDIPTKLDKANVVVDVGHAVYLGDTLFVLGDMNLLADDLREWNAKGQIIMVFHGDAAYLVLNDETYNSNRHVATGNPYKKILNGLMEKGVHLELCGATAKGNHWGNANLLPDVNVNVNAMVRVTQLEQQGYTLIYQ